MPPKLLIPLYLAVLLAPLALAALGGRPPRSLWDELASGAGMLAFTILLVEFVLSGRFRTVSARIGMDVTMRFHQVIARTALALVLLHPILYAAPFAAPYPWDPTRELTLYSGSRGLATGVLAWVLLVALVVFGIGRRQLALRYESWRLTHGLGALAVAGLALDHTLVAGRYSQDAALVALWSGLTAAAAFSLAWVYAIKPFLQTRRPWRVAGVRALAERAWELAIEPEGHDGLRFDAGQFVWLNVGKSPFSLDENPFSISSAPAEGPGLRFVIKELGDFTRTVGAIAPGTRAHLDGPFGSLVVAGRTEPGVALIAGGVGVAPALSILRQLRSEGDPRPIHLVYGNRTEAQIVYRAELDALAAGAPQIEVTHVLAEPPAGWTGRAGVVDAALIRALFDDPAHKDWLYVICGPPAMIEGAEQALIDLGVPSHQILSERFQYD
eukprot:g994.t1